MTEKNKEILAGLLCCPDCSAPISRSLACTACGRSFAAAEDGIVGAMPRGLSGEREEKESILRRIESGEEQEARGVVLYEKAFHDQQASYYDRLFVDPLPLRVYYGRLAKKQIYEQVRNQPFVVDLCCGTGKSSIPMAEAGLTVVAVDVSREMLRVYKRKCDQAGLSNVILVQADASAPPLRKGSCGAITMIGGLHHIPDRPGCLERISHSLAPGGLLILHEPLKTGCRSRATDVLANLEALTDPARVWRAVRRRLGLSAATAAAAEGPDEYTPFETPFSSANELTGMLPQQLRPVIVSSQGIMSLREFGPNWQNLAGSFLARLVVAADVWLSSRPAEQAAGSALFAVLKRVQDVPAADSGVMAGKGAAKW